VVFTSDFLKYSENIWRLYGECVADAVKMDAFEIGATEQHFF
jgi:hypothetical protein